MIVCFSFFVGYIPWTHPSSHFFLRGYSRFTFIQIPSRYFFFPSFYLGYSTPPLSSLLPPLLPSSSWTCPQKGQNPTRPELTSTITSNVKRRLTPSPLSPPPWTRPTPGSPPRP